MIKNNATKILIFILFILALLSGYNFFQKPFIKMIEKKQAELKLAQSMPVVTPVVTTNEDAVFSNLTTEQKIWQLISVPVSLSEYTTATTSAELEFIYQHNPGFVTIFGSKLDLETVKNFTNNLPASEAGFKTLVAVDHEGGTVQRLTGDGFTILPSWANLCMETAAEKISLFETSARELRSAGINIVFAPVIDVPRVGSFLKSRACQSQVASLDTAESYIKAFGEQGIFPVVKHYPGIGSLTKDLHDYQAEVFPGSQDTLPFQKVFEVFPNIGVMTAHVIVPDRTDGLPCSLSSVCLDPFPIHFPDVMIFVDALEMKSAVTQDENGEDVSLATTAKMALMAGNNVLVFGDKLNYQELELIVGELVKVYDEDSEFRSKVDASVYKILDKKIFD
ncbi:MAG: glycoside hydrolase family 3 protein [Candidatus Pacebacteria bacterium]|nr:glycoside hydrolase family 3 protein [Candidatus Paceibacterota bacterium]